MDADEWGARTALAHSSFDDRIARVRERGRSREQQTERERSHAHNGIVETARRRLSAKQARDVQKTVIPEAMTEKPC
jgi:hypothetical protein